MKINVESFLGIALIEMLKLAPKNPVFRSQLHATMMKPLPDHIDTFEDILKWCEMELEAKVKDVPECPQFYFDGKAEWQETGTANYQIYRNRAREYELLPDVIKASIFESMNTGACLETALDALRVKMIEHIRLDPPPLEVEEEEDRDPYRDARYSRQRATGTRGVSYYPDVPAQKLVNFVKEYFPIQFAKMQAISDQMAEEEAMAQRREDEEAGINPPEVPPDPPQAQGWVNPFEAINVGAAPAPQMAAQTIERTIEQLLDPTTQDNGTQEEETEHDGDEEDEGDPDERF